MLTYTESYLIKDKMLHMVVVLSIGVWQTYLKTPVFTQSYRK